MTEESVDEFKLMIDRAVDQEELETLRQMLLESSDLAFAEKELLSNYLNVRSHQVPELRHQEKERELTNSRV